ncbi:MULTISPECIES: hypothetical protein [unclassified Exiguobacterium]|uniref:hypothetical protein n=1 Tax=unclassified Exiguobacterium TaxID=2644629 RepID=UPI00103F2A45|nr:MULTISPECIES: hypothetical protein [unclassified Exiguobacterium]TCI24285.1 hypothetical protein EVJ32_14635 [Exiguobacterium sp. SH5S4]TCI56148.1 hypothetical protein EVJ30_04475 [Exiguobacterium sp. SH5S13]TCI61730.1 hypothetical protein EVJ26_09210 [Exiguobacterium sp. SH3S1]
MKNYTPSFMILSSAALAFGLGFKSIFPYAMLIGAGLHTIFLLCAAYSLGKYRANTSQLDS